MPSCTASGIPPARVATTGLPNAIASNMAVPRPSRYDENTKISKRCMSARISWRKPVKQTWAVMPSAVSLRSSVRPQGTVTRNHDAEPRLGPYKTGR